MNDRQVWPGENNPIAQINFKLMAGFDTEGQPIYASGEVDSAEELRAVQSILEPLKPVPHTITSVTMGEVLIELADGNKVILRPVFHPSLNTYGDLFFVDEGQYPMPKELVDVFERWRSEAKK
jgi:hypothetical protein